MRQQIPKYSLYGEASHDADERFLHVEAIAERSRLHDWVIEPHSHADLHHLLLVTSGRGVMHAEGVAQRFRCPALIRVPIACVHGFAFEPGTDGWIVTVSGALLGRIASAYPELAPLFADAASVPLASTDAPVLEKQFRTLAGEFRGAGRARRAAVESSLLAIQVAAVRLLDRRASPAAISKRSDSALTERFRSLVERHYRDGRRISSYAARLCVSTERLRQACVRTTGHAPIALLNARRLLEAKRGLEYTNMSVSAVAASCGFDDPAYFSRFFAREAGESPRAYRSRRSADLIAAVSKQG